MARGTTAVEQGPAAGPVPRSRLYKAVPRGGVLPLSLPRRTPPMRGRPSRHGGGAQAARGGPRIGTRLAS